MFLLVEFPFFFLFLFCTKIDPERRLRSLVRGTIYENLDEIRTRIFVRIFPVNERQKVKTASEKIPSLIIEIIVFIERFAKQ